jgi:hypothetical protein
MSNDDPVLIQDFDTSWPDVFSNFAARVEGAHGSLKVAV